MAIASSDILLLFDIHHFAFLYLKPTIVAGKKKKGKPKSGELL